MTRTTSCVAGVVTPRDAIASMNAPVSSRSLHAGSQLDERGSHRRVGHLDGGADGVDLLDRLGASRRSQGGPAVDDVRIGKRHRQQLCEQR